MEYFVALISNKFLVKGMTCQSCVEKVSELLKLVPNVSDVNVNLSENSATFKSDLPVSLETVKSSLAHLTKYSVDNFTSSTLSTKSEKPEENSVSKFTTYKPLIAVFAFVLLVSFAFQIFLGSFHFHLFMNHIMAGFFIGLSFFKFLSIKAFAESFSGYDPIARRFTKYGLVYPFIEVALGLLFISGKFIQTANVITILILTVTTVGVIKRLQSKTQIQCACLGTAFSLPLSNITVFENVAMILMAAFSIFSLV